MSDDSVEVLKADGSIWKSTPYKEPEAAPKTNELPLNAAPDPVVQRITSTASRPISKTKSPRQKPVEEVVIAASPAPVEVKKEVELKWTITTSDGELIEAKEDGSKEVKKTLLASTAQCQDTGEVGGLDTFI